MAATKKDIEDIGFGFYNIFNLTVKSGDRTQFWHDFWSDAGKLKTTFPELYNLESYKRCLVGERIHHDGVIWDWKSSPAGYGLSEEVTRLTNVIANTHIGEGPDQVICPLVADGRYKVCLLNRKIDKNPIPNLFQLKVIWSKLIPIKVTMFIWRAAQGRIPSTLALASRGVNTESTHYGSCINCLECFDHILI